GGPGRGELVLASGDRAGPGRGRAPPARAGRAVIPSMPGREERILFLCARQDFLPGHREAVEALGRRPVRWQRLTATAEEHGVLPVVGSHLRSCNLELPPGLEERLETAVFENALLKEQD